MKNASQSHLRIRALCEGAILLALAIVLNYLSSIIFGHLPQGGSITLAMFPLLLFVHRWGFVRGLMVCFAYGLLDMLLGGGYAWGWQSILLDYLVAYTALALGGFFRGKAWGIFPAWPWAAWAGLLCTISAESPCTASSNPPASRVWKRWVCSPIPTCTPSFTTACICCPMC